MPICWTIPVIITCCTIYCTTHYTTLYTYYTLHGWHAIYTNILYYYYVITILQLLNSNITCVTWHIIEWYYLCVPHYLHIFTVHIHHFSTTATLVMLLIDVLSYLYNYIILVTSNPLALLLGLHTKIHCTLYTGNMGLFVILSICVRLSVNRPLVSMWSLEYSSQLLHN